MPTVTELAQYQDERGNEIVFSGHITKGIKIKFTGSGNRLVVADKINLGSFVVDFDCDNGTVEIGPTNRFFAAAIRVGQDACVRIGKTVSSTTSVYISAVEGTTVQVGDDVMFASQNQIRGDDGHPIFDSRTGERINPAKSVTIGNHVWLGGEVVVLGGAVIGDGTVVGLRSLVTGTLPNNCIAVGIPARVIRRDIGWDRSHLSMTAPFYKPHRSTIGDTKWDNLTVEPLVPPPVSPLRMLVRRVRRRLSRR
ncbi:MAG: acyltransferase [Jatrophihabitans sp.]